MKTGTKSLKKLEGKKISKISLSKVKGGGFLKITGPDING